VEPEYIFRDTAFKHGHTETDIRHAFETCRYMGQYGDRENLYLLLGFDMKANPVEVLYNEFGVNGVNVIHAMPCRPRFYRLLEEEETL
jgi:hypothetical protein